MSIDRRGFLRLSAASLAGVAAARFLDPAALFAQTGPAAPAAAGKGKACILLWMNGGPSHIDTFDPKPKQKTPLSAIKTSAPGVQICQHLPQLAAQAHRLAIVRSMSSKEGNHQRAQYLGHTGYSPNPTVSHPSLGAWTSAEAGALPSELPRFVSLGGPSIGGGFLGVQHAPLIVQDQGKLPRNTEAPAGVDADRFDRRSAALAALEQDFATASGDAKVAGRRAVYEKAARMMRAPALRAFDVGEEPEAVKAAYGDTDFGRGCLAARRLVEAGVPFVEVVLDGWDTHKDNFGRVTKLMGAVDPAMSALLRELDERRLLDRTLVVWMGEFGRSPKISSDDGRDHHPAAWSAVLAGAGVRGGVVHGATDDEGDKVAGQPTSVPDLLATVATQLGMDPAQSAMTPRGRPISLTDSGTPIRAILR